MGRHAPTSKEMERGRVPLCQNERIEGAVLIEGLMDCDGKKDSRHKGIEPSHHILVSHIYRTE